MNFMQTPAAELPPGFAWIEQKNNKRPPGHVIPTE